MMFGVMAVVYTLMSGGSFLLALGVYSLSGTLVVLALAFLAALRAERTGSENRLAITPAE